MPPKEVYCVGWTSELFTNMLSLTNAVHLSIGVIARDPFPQPHIKSLLKSTHTTLHRNIRRT